MNPETQDILEKVIGYGILAMLVIGIGWKLWLILFSLLYLIFNWQSERSDCDECERGNGDDHAAFHG